MESILYNLKPMHYEKYFFSSLIAHYGQFLWTN